MSGRRIFWCRVSALACVLAWSAVAGAAVVGRVVHVGFPAAMGDVVRPGAWTPVVVDLSLQGSSGFDGFLRVSQRDKDGDLAYDRIPVQLRAEAAPQRRYILYCVTGPAGGEAGAVSVDVLDENGDIVEVISADSNTPVRSLRVSQAPDRLRPDHYLLLALSNGAIGTVAYLEGADQRDKFDRPVHVAHLAPADLPDRWQGLEMVDAVVWEAANATELSSAQLDALVTWVRQGGHLLIAASRTADTIARSQRLAEVLPVTIGLVAPQAQLNTLRNQLLGDANSRAYADALPVAMCQTAPGARALLTEKAIQAVLVAERRVERGRVVFVAAELQDLTSEQGLSPVAFYRSLLQLRRPRLTEVSAPPSATALFPVLEQTVGFRRSTGVYLLAAVLFSVVYVGVATFGSWRFLRSRDWTRYAWSSFAIVAAAASVLSWMAVQSMRGVGQSLQQLSIVDATAGEARATATAYFGVKTGLDSVLDVWMPSNYAQASEPERTQCYLKPLPTSAEEWSSASSFADPRRYRLVPASALLEDVPVRATLKQFEGRWLGNLRRTLEADVRVGEISDETGADDGVLRGSTITNKLGHTLRNCLLIQPTRDAFLANFADMTPRQDRIYVHSVGDIADGETVDLAERIYAAPDGVGVVAVETWRKRTLAENHKNWGNKFVTATLFGGGSDVVERFRLEDYQDALLMLTTLGEHAPITLQSQYHTSGFDFSRRHCVQLDRGAELAKDRFLLIGFTDDQGPVMLSTRSGGGDFRPLLADEAHTMYRFWIPVTGM